MNMFELLRMLEEARVEYVLIGGLAVTLRGYQRVTMDVDVALAMTPANLRTFVDAAKASGMLPVMPVSLDAFADVEQIDRWHAEKGMLAFALRHPAAQSTVLDVLVKPAVGFEDLRRRAERVPIGPLSIPVASVDDLILLKTGTGRSKDAVDIAELRKLAGGEDR